MFLNQKSLNTAVIMYTLHITSWVNKGTLSKIHEITPNIYLMFCPPVKTKKIKHIRIRLSLSHLSDLLLG